MHILAERALEWVGKEFRPGIPAQCMNFVRHILKEVDHPLKDKVTKKPVDGLWTALGLANSLAGRDLGPIFVKPEELISGDIVFFEDTYEGPWPPKTITHVGIYTANNYGFVHRPTMSRPVELSSLTIGSYWRTKFRCALRPKPLQNKTKRSIKVEKPKPITVEIIAKDNKLFLCIGDQPCIPIQNLKLTGTVISSQTKK